MYAKLGLCALACFAVSAVCLGGAWAIGGNGLGDAALGFGGFGMPRCDVSGPAPTATSRTLAWDGDDRRAAVALSANTVWRAGEGDRLVVRGDPRIVAHVRVRDGVVAMDCQDASLFGPHDGIEVTLPGRRSFKAFEQMGSGDMALKGISQPQVKLAISGSGHIEADAKTHKTVLDISGSGSMNTQLQTDELALDVSGSGDVAARGRAGSVDADVSGNGAVHTNDLAVRTADLNISGSGVIETAARDNVQVDISGSGRVALKNEPKTLETHFSGSGKVIHPDGREEGRHHGHHDDD